MIPTTSVEWSDWPSSNYHLGHSIKRDTARKAPREHVQHLRPKRSPS